MSFHCKPLYIRTASIKTSIHLVIGIVFVAFLLSCTINPNTIKIDFMTALHILFLFYDCLCYLFNGSQMCVLERPKKVQNLAARPIFQCRKQNHISPLLMSLHWLPINARIEYKLSVICHSFFLGLSPIYLFDLLLVYTPQKNLRSSSDNRILCIPKLRTKTFGHRSFPFATPTMWNSLPTEVRHTNFMHKFISAVKTHLLRLFYA